MSFSIELGVLQEVFESSFETTMELNMNVNEFEVGDCNWCVLNNIVSI